MSLPAQGEKSCLFKRLYRILGGKGRKKSVYETYYEFSQKVNKIAGHRVLALNRGEKEGFLKVSVTVDAEKPLNAVYSMFVKGDTLRGCRKGGLR